MKTVLFDLDGTLLPMDQDEFAKGYFGLLVKRMAPLGYDPEKLVKAIWTGTYAMVANDGSRTNETVFWAAFMKEFGERVLKDRPVVEDFYRTDFEQARAFCGFAPESAEVVEGLRAAGRRVALATNPIFPRAATEARIRWAGLRPDQFELVTTYENTRSCKPNPRYFVEVASRLGVDPADCIVIGNDAEEDLAAMEVGMEVFLLTPCLINRKERNISQCPQGGFAELKEYLHLT